jgi:hypothetical protein
MDFFALANEEVAKREYWSLIGVATTTAGADDDMESARHAARAWLESRSRPR